MNRRATLPATPPRSGLTLLEVLLSLAILAAVLVAVAPVVDAGMRGAVAAELETEATLIAANSLNAIESGLAPMSAQSASGTSHPMLLREIAVAPVDGRDLTAVTVTVSSDRSPDRPHVRVSLTRWIRAVPDEPTRSTPVSTRFPR